MPASSSPLARSSTCFWKRCLLVDGVVELGEGVAHLTAADEQLEPLGEAGVLGGALGQGGDIHRVHGDEGGLDELLLHLLVEALIQGVAPGVLRARPCSTPTDLAAATASASSVMAMKSTPRYSLTASAMVIRGQPGVRSIFSPCHVHLIGAQDLLGGGGEQVLEQVHHVVEVGVGLVELHGGELRVVLGVHALVAEDAADLIHPLQAADDEPLQVQLGGDAHVHVDVQGVVVGDEGAGGGAAGDGVQHGGLHLHVAPAIQEGPQVA